MSKTPTPKNSLAEQELDKAKEQFDAFEDNIKSLTLDRLNSAPKEELEPQTKLSQQDKDRMNRIYLKPAKTISSREKFNERFRDSYEFDKEYVYFTAENKEMIGERIEMWTKPYPGVPAEFWEVPTNKPLWAPRYVAEQIKKCSYHRLRMDENRIVETHGTGQYYGQMAVDTTVPRLDAYPESTRRSIFMGDTGF